MKVLMWNSYDCMEAILRWIMSVCVCVLLWVADYITNYKLDERYFFLHYYRYIPNALTVLLLVIEVASI